LAVPWAFQLPSFRLNLFCDGNDDVFCGRGVSYDHGAFFYDDLSSYDAPQP